MLVFPLAAPFSGAWGWHKASRLATSIQTLVSDGFSCSVLLIWPVKGGWQEKTIPDHGCRRHAVSAPLGMLQSALFSFNTAVFCPRLRVFRYFRIFSNCPSTPGGVFP